MSFRLLYTPRAEKDIARTPAALADCIAYHLGEMERADRLPGQRVTFPHPEGMGYYFRCRDETAGGTYQLVALYRVGQDEVTLVLFGLGWYPVADPPPD